jgi:hypothetical protein
VGARLPRGWQTKTISQDRPSWFKIREPDNVRDRAGACKGLVRCRGSEKDPINLLRDDYLAGHVGLELANVILKMPLKCWANSPWISERFGTRDLSRAWFSNMLDALIEIACPNSDLNGKGRAFLETCCMESANSSMRSGDNILCSCLAAPQLPVGQRAPRGSAPFFSTTGVTGLSDEQTVERFDLRNAIRKKIRSPNFGVLDLRQLGSANRAEPPL